jgi:hypothetical protein
MRPGAASCVLGALLMLGCGGGGRAGDDAGTDAEADVGAEDVGDDEPSGDPVVEDATEDTGVEDVEDVEDVGEEEAVLPGCGDGVTDAPAGEVCDDANAVTEHCGASDPEACLADCTMQLASCGNGADDAGEECDDGDADSMNACTTSCTVNDHDVGAPCRCTSGCDALDFTAGTIDGCGTASFLADGTRSLACVRSSVDGTYGEAVYSAAGFCTLIAIGCSGTLCFLVPETGDVDAFSCPSGSAVLAVERVRMGMTITVKTCHPLCSSDAGCRWNESEPAGSPWEGACGQYSCLPEGEGGARICVDPRNLT